MTLEQIATEAAQLDEESRASLASRLLQSLAPPAGVVSDQEVMERISEAKADPSVMISHEELISGVARSGN